MTEPDNRRPLKSRGAAWAKDLAQDLAKAEVRPNLISALSLVFALGGGVMLLAGGSFSGPARVVVLLLAAISIQLRLACNLLDGMVAVEHGKGSPSGPIWNELPDRASDVMLLVCAGYGAQAAGVDGAAAFGWLAAVLAVACAYVRELGRGLGQPADFAGPMAKPQRMAVLTGAALVGVIEPAWGWRGETLAIGLGVVAAGTAVTIARRTARLARALAARKGDAEE